MRILAHGRHFYSSRPVVVIEGLVIGETEESVLVEVSVVGQLDVAGRGAGALGHVLTHHEEFEASRADHFRGHDGTTFGVL